MRISLAIAALATGLISTCPAFADEPARGFGRRPAYAAPNRTPLYAPAPRRYGYGAPRHRHFSYRPGPIMVDSPVHVTLYREAYIGRGLIYNTPPTLDRPGGFGPVLSARY